jgi:GR25 family glycosyltransferase involved in LPS biosynthesis
MCSIACTSLNSGSKGQIYSHIALWKRMVEESIPFLTIFEDDCLPHKELGKGLGQTFWNATPKDFDIVYLGNAMNPNDPLLKDPHTFVVPVPSFSLHSYILSLEGAKKILSFLKEFNSNINPLETLQDHFIQWQKNKSINLYCWNGTWQQKSYPTYDGGLPWRAFQDIITPQKDTGLIWTNIRLGSTVRETKLKLHTPEYV